MNRRFLGTLFATALCLGVLASPALAQINISVDIGTPPPPPRHERVIEEVRPGWFWVPGFWYWEGHRHHWAKGHWERERPGRRWIPARWEDHDGRHHYEPPRWERDDRRDDRRDEGWHDNGKHKGQRRNHGDD